MVSILGPHHETLAYHMTFRAVLAAVTTAVGLFILAMAASVPFTLVIPPLYVVAELVFAVIYIYRYLLLSYQPIKHRPLSHDPWDAFQRAMQHMQQFTDIRHFLSIWFHGAPFEDIKRENVADLLAYAFFYRTMGEVVAEGLSAELESMVAYIERTWGVELAAGYNPKLRWMCHLWEPMRHWYRPLGFYLFMELAAWIGNTALRAAGFQRSVWMGITYFKRNMHTSKHQPWPGAAGQDWGDSSGEDVPLVLLHGIGMGLIPYISLLFNMAATGRPVLALQLKHVSMRWVLWVPTVDEVAEVLVGILRREAVDRCCLVAHSYGTAVASRLLQQHPHKIFQLCMVDPVCFSMFMPNLLRNFLYESPRTGSWFGDFMMMSAARDLHVAATLSRRFFWTDVNLWEEQLPPGALVVLSGRDVLMAAAEVKAWLELRTDAVVMYNPELPHAGFLMDVKWQQKILERLLPLLDHMSQQQHQHLNQDPQTTCTFNASNASDADQQQLRVSPVPPKSPLPLQQRVAGVTERSTASDSCSRGSSIELTAVAALGMDRPRPHVLSGGIPSAAVPATPVRTGGTGSPHSSCPLPVPAGLDMGCVISSQVNRGSHTSSLIGASGTATLSSSSDSSRVSSSSSGVGIWGQGAVHAIAVGAHQVESTDDTVVDHCSSSNIPPAGVAAQLSEPLQFWNDLLHSSQDTHSIATACRGLAGDWGAEFSCDVQPVRCSAESSGTTADCTDSPRTYFSGMSSQSWQDFAQLAHGMEAATAARVLLQPLFALQQHRQQRQQQQKASRIRRDDEILSGQEFHYADPSRDSQGSTLEPGSMAESCFGSSSSQLVAGASPRSAASTCGTGHSSRREAMMRRVEVLLHRRGGRQRGSSSGGDSAARRMRAQGNIVL